MLPKTLSKIYAKSKLSLLNLNCRVKSRCTFKYFLLGMQTELGNLATSGSLGLNKQSLPTVVAILDYASDSTESENLIINL